CIAEIAGKNWPPLSATELIAPSPALSLMRHFARRLFSETVPMPVAEFIYKAAESSTPLSRAMLLNLGATVKGLGNEGDAIDALRGKWLESVENDRLRVTPMLHGSAAEQWPEMKRHQAHQCIYDAIA